MNQPMNEPTNKQAGNQPTNQPTNQSINQWINQSINQSNQPSNHLNHNLCTDHINQLHALVGLPSRLWTTAAGSFHADGLSPSPVIRETNWIFFLGTKGIPKITKLLNWFCPNVNRNMCANNSRANKNHGYVALEWFSLRSFFQILLYMSRSISLGYDKSKKQFTHSLQYNGWINSGWFI